ncbi:MAG: amidohydrolase [Eubacteriales bacterium]|nr:amidohydrolase [Clostridia bacterium]MDD4583327.1 amidohydrolase [Eubacteriales bacterium]
MFADYIIKSNCIFDSCSDEPFAGSIAVIKDKIAYIGKDADKLSEYVGEDTQILTYDDKLVMPGICESHAHVFYGALEVAGANVAESLSEEEAVQMIFDHEKNKDNEWIIAFGWNHEYWRVKELPTKDSLDKMFPNKPVVVINEELHGAWVNSKALEICRIDEDTVIPPGMGMIAKDSEGKPTGYLLETYAMKLVLDVAFAMPGGKQSYLIDEYFKTTARLGITSLSNMQIHEILMEDVFERLDKEGKLKVRMSLLASINTPMEKLLAMKSRYNSDTLKFGGIKGFVDGTPMGYTGTLVEEYSDHPGFYGEKYLSVKDFGEKAKAFESNGIRMRLHACGDGAVREALDIYEYCRSAGGKDPLRHTIEHFEVVHPDDMGRAGELGIVASVQPDHMWAPIFSEHPFHKILGEERCKYVYPFKSMADLGAVLAFGSDHPIAELNPMRGIYRAVARLSEDKLPEGGWCPNEKLSLADSLKAYTIGSAYQMWSDDVTGTLEEGKFADIAVLDRNLFKVDVEEILETTVIMAMLGGQIIHEI